MHQHLNADQTTHPCTTVTQSRCCSANLYKVLCDKFDVVDIHLLPFIQTAAQSSGRPQVGATDLQLITVAL